MIEDLLVRRDRRVGRYAQLDMALQNHDLEVLNQLDLDWAADLEALESEHQRRKTGAH